MGKKGTIISPRIEFTFVTLGAFGYSILASILYVFAGSNNGSISEIGLQFLIIYEIVVLSLVGGFLFLRGWTLDKIGLTPGIKETGTGVLLAIVAQIATYLASTIAIIAIPDLQNQSERLVTPDLTLFTVLLISIINPLFEEIFVCGYVISAIKQKRSIFYAINVSTGIRMSYHLYQGSVGVVGIIPIGLVFSYWYAKTGRLWPVVVAHALFDFIALSFYIKI